MTETRGADEALRRRPRLGHTASLDCLPLYWGLARSAALLDVELTTDTPGGLSRRLLGGELDIAALPVAVYLRHRESLLALPGIAAGSDGPMMSSVLVSDLGPGELDGRSVALAGAGPTSRRLARLLLEQRYGVAARYLPDEAGAGDEQGWQLPGGSVLFGDTALRASVAGGGVHDLAGLWRDWTGLPFVFAVWAVRRDYARLRPEAVATAHRGLLAARDLARTESARLAARAARWQPFRAETLAHYFGSVLDFSLGPRQLAGLAEFARRTGRAAPAPAEWFTS